MDRKAQALNSVINKTITPIICNPKCKYYVFAHLERPCVLSEVYGAKRGELCYDYKFEEG